MRTPSVVVAAAVAASAAGCSQPSATIDTNRIQASTVITADGSPSTRVHTSLAVNAVQDLILDDGDALYAEVGDRSELMATVDSGEYEATLLDVAPLATVTVNFERDNGDPAPDTHVAIPAAFDVEPFAQASYGRNAIVPLRWSPTLPAGSMGIYIEGACIVTVSRVVLDTGSLDIQGLATVDFPTEPCEVTVRVTRSAGGVVDRAFDEGFSGVHADQVRTATFVSTPP